MSDIDDGLDRMRAGIDEVISGVRARDRDNELLSLSMDKWEMVNGFFGGGWQLAKIEGEVDPRSFGRY